ncbi:MAG: hypothetical protein LBQ61_08065 [Spirochaetales bacterium]|nr:hypothetical protein [Spirochaetales bacterium]
MINYRDSLMNRPAKKFPGFFLLALVLLGCLALGSCSDSNEGDDGNLVISFPGAGENPASLAAVPGPGTLARLEYRLTLTNAGEIINLVVPGGQNRLQISLAPGVWEIGAEAYLPAGEEHPVHVGTGSTQARIAAGQSASATIKMIFDNTIPASVEVEYKGQTYTALREGNVYTVESEDRYDSSQTVTVTVHKALPDQDVDETNLTGQSVKAYFLGGQTFTVSAGAGYSTEYILQFVFPFPYNLVDPISDPTDLKQRFGITTTGAQGVTETFNALHELISNPYPGDDFTSFIRLGDWIDLDSLTVAPYPAEVDEDDEDGVATPNSQDGYGYIVTGNTDLGAHGKLLRLIVVGMGKSAADDEAATLGAPNYRSLNTVNDNDTPHVVFHFQNIPGFHRTNPPGIVGDISYLNSEIRTYLVNNFYTGLTAAGLPDAVVWAPSRRVTNQDYNGVDPIEDKLWLPTKGEMGGTYEAYEQETADDQASFAGYYTDDTSRLKYDSSNTPKDYRLASLNGNDFVGNDGGIYSSGTHRGCVPLFCVK